MTISKTGRTVGFVSPLTGNVLIVIGFILLVPIENIMNHTQLTERVPEPRADNVCTVSV